MKLALFAYSSLGSRVFDVVDDLGVDIVALFTHEDAPDETLWFSPAAQRASSLGVPVFFSPPYRRFDCAAELESLGADIVLSASFRSPLARTALEVPRLGAYNLHGSLLPRYRGRSPVNWAILNGETETGITLHVMVEEVDAGDVVLARRVAIGPDDTALDVLRKQEEHVESMLREALPGIASGRPPRTPQDGSRASYHGGRRPDDGLIDWSLPARRIHDLVRAVTRPFPGAFTHRRGRRITIWKSRTIPGPGRGPGEPQRLADGGFAIGTGDGLVEVLLCGLDDNGPDEPGSRLAEIW